MSRQHKLLHYGQEKITDWSLISVCWLPRVGSNAFVSKDKNTPFVNSSSFAAQFQCVKHYVITERLVSQITLSLLLMSPGSLLVSARKARQKYWLTSIMVNQPFNALIGLMKSLFQSNRDKRSICVWYMLEIFINLLMTYEPLCKLWGLWMITQAWRKEHEIDNRCTA